MTEIYWFRSDLRLDDNPGLKVHCRAKSLLCVFFWPRQVPWCNLTGIGGQRERFLLESLHALNSELTELGQQLHVLREAPAAGISALVDRYKVKAVGVARAPGVYERRDVEEVAARLQVPLQVHTGNTLFSAESVLTAKPELPRQFTPFRRSMENFEPVLPEGKPRLPPPPSGVKHSSIPNAKVRPAPSFVARGGAMAGENRLRAWMHREQAVASYGETRNQLDGLFYSSFLSPWLANGNLSVRRLHLELGQFEAAHGRNSSTEHFYSELLWREFFHWRALTDDVALYRAGGIAGKRKLSTFDPRSFARWCAGATNYPLVNALMHQLVATGWMSNRGRQIAASCLLNEMNVDWRFGAAFFEQHLLDYDVASNYGNWQYIAGVGTDPRGGRHFNIGKQAAQFDPDGDFVQRWQGDCPEQPEHIVDAADWPIG